MPISDYLEDLVSHLLTHPKSSGTQMEKTPEHTNGRIRFVWLVAAHVVVGVLASLQSDSFEPRTGRSAFFSGIVFGQISLLGIWAVLGGTVLSKRMIDVAFGLSYLTCLSGLVEGRIGGPVPVFFFSATASTMFVMFIVRFITGAIYHDRPSTGAARSHQFSIRQLFVLTSVIACLTAIGTLGDPHVDAPSNGLFVEMIVYGIVLGIVYALIALVPMWSVLATKRPAFYGMCVVAVEACLAYQLGQIADPSSDLLALTAVATQAMSVVISLLFVRSWGYRLMRTPPSDPAMAASNGER